MLSDILYRKSFGQGLIAAIIYAEFFKESLLWCAGTSSLKGRKHELLLLRSLKNAQLDALKNLLKVSLHVLCLRKEVIFNNHFL